MSISTSTKVWLGLDKWAEIIGVHPLHFSGLYLPDEETSGCSQLWQQYDWQSPNNVSREGLARAIAEAERQISSYLSYNLLPDWLCDEEVIPVKPRAYRGQYPTLTVSHKHIIAGGVRATELLVAAGTIGSSIVMSDEDDDGYAETATITAEVPAGTDVCEIRCYFADRLANDLYEIKPLESIDITGTTLTIVLKRWLLVDYMQLGGFRKVELNAAVDTSYVLWPVPVDPEPVPFDIYRVYNDPSVQATLKWIGPECGLCGGTGCETCQESEQTACLTVKNSRLGQFAYSPANWDEDLLAWVAAGCCVSRVPDRALVSYYSGLRAAHSEFSGNCVCPGQRMLPALEQAVAYLAAALLDRDMCDCNNTVSFVNNWREDLAASGEGLTSYQVSGKELANPFGTRRGAVEAWRILTTREGLRVNP